MKDIPETEVCPRDDIAAYVDGELSGEASEAFELHLDGCFVCRRSLRQQRQFLAALSASLGTNSAVDLPEDYTRKIVTRAESSVSGVRRPNELFTAICICLTLFIFALFAFGGEALKIATAAGGMGEKLLTVGSIVLKTAGHVVYAVAVVSRSLAGSVDARVMLGLAAVVIGAVVVYLSSSWRIRRRSA